MPRRGCRRPISSRLTTVSWIVWPWRCRSAFKSWVSVGPPCEGCASQFGRWLVVPERPSDVQKVTTNVDHCVTSETWVRADSLQQIGSIKGVAPAVLSAV
jgi:hypothetical protein